MLYFKWIINMNMSVICSGRDKSVDAEGKWVVREMTVAYGGIRGKESSPVE